MIKALKTQSQTQTGEAVIKCANKHHIALEVFSKYNLQTAIQNSDAILTVTTHPIERYREIDIIRESGKPFYVSNSSKDIPSIKKWLDKLPDINLCVLGDSYELTRNILDSLLMNVIIPEWLFDSYVIAERMYALAKLEGLSEATCENAWLLGLVHNIGERFYDKDTEKRSASILARNGYNVSEFVAHSNIEPQKNLPWLLHALSRAKRL